MMLSIAHTVSFPPVLAALLWGRPGEESAAIRPPIIAPPSGGTTELPPSNHAADPASPREARFGYFAVQTHIVPDAAGDHLAGVLEDLGTGERRAFSSGDALGRLVAEWAARTGLAP